MKEMNKWDQYFLNICREVGKNSKCHSRQIGSVLTKDNIIIATGYNGPPRGVPPCDQRYENDPLLAKTYSQKITNVKLDLTRICPRKTMQFPSGEGLEWCPAIHAEKNCLLAAARNGISTKDTIMYIDAEISSCSQCLGACINAGVKKIVVLKTTPYDVTVEWLIANSDIEIVEFNIKK